LYSQLFKDWELDGDLLHAMGNDKLEDQKVELDRLVAMVKKLRKTMDGVA
jgi:hypothetical protein